MNAFKKLQELTKSLLDLTALGIGFTKTFRVLPNIQPNTNQTTSRRSKSNTKSRQLTCRHKEKTPFARGSKERRGLRKARNLFLLFIVRSFSRGLLVNTFYYFVIFVLLLVNTLHSPCQLPHKNSKSLF